MKKNLPADVIAVHGGRPVVRRVRDFDFTAYAEQNLRYVCNSNLINEQILMTSFIYAMHYTNRGEVILEVCLEVY